MSQIISLEGISGSGKSSQVSFIYTLFKPDISIVPELNQFSPLKEVILEWRERQALEGKVFFSEQDIFRLAKARAQTQERIISKLKTSKIIMDRSVYTSLVYEQGSMEMKEIEKINRKEGVIFPDICFVLDCEPDTALSRINQRRNLSATYKSASIHETIAELNKRRKGYLSLIKEYPRLYLIDANKLETNISNQIKEILERK